MAALQGYLLIHKGNMEGSIDGVHKLLLEEESRTFVRKEETPVKSVSDKKQIKPRPVKPLTAAEVDKMFFNPQKDWDKGL